MKAPPFSVVIPTLSARVTRWMSQPVVARRRAARELVEGGAHQVRDRIGLPGRTGGLLEPSLAGGAVFA
jgi:hypothetical protein